jgi:hypothetical protein
MGEFYCICFLKFLDDFVCGQKCRDIWQKVLPFSFFKNLLKSIFPLIRFGNLALGVVSVLKFPLKPQSV